MKILIYALSGGMFLTLFLVIYLIQDLPFDRLQKVDNLLMVSSRNSKEISVLEDGAGVIHQELQNYYLFSEEKQNFKSWLRELIDLKKIEEQGKIISINETLEIADLLENNCSRIYCYQHKIKFDYIPSIFWKGLIGIEDLRFLDHAGVDLRAILRAAVKDIQVMKFVQGGSTLTQQLVKNLLLSNKRSLIRKLKEVLLSIYIELKFSKHEILEAYFNEVYWGSLQGFQIRGIYSAALFYFNKRLDDLRPYEAAILISLLKGPGHYNPIRHLDRLIKRVVVVYKRLVDLKLFVPKKEFYWTKKQWKKWQKELIFRNESKPFFALAIKHSGSKAKIVNKYEEYLLVAKVDNIVRRVKKNNNSEQFAAKVIIGIPSDNTTKQYIYYSKPERSLVRAFENERHQVGSILKPLLYSIYLENGILFDDEISTDKIELELKSGKWSPREAHKDLSKVVTVKEALWHSYNRPVIKLAKKIGFLVLEKELQRYIPRLLTPLEEYPAQLLGSVEISMNEIYKIYQQFISKECKNFLMTQNMKNSVLFSLSSPENTTIRRAVGKNFKKLRFFGKTGTTNNGYNNWFVFYDGYHLGIIWVGFEGRKKGKSFRLFGSTTAFPIFQGFFRDRGKRFNEMNCDRWKSIANYDLQ